MLKRFRIEKEGDNGWSRWVQPVARNYLMSCCDCGLVHRMEFRVLRERAQFRAQRAPGYTRQERKRIKRKAS